MDSIFHKCPVCKRVIGDTADHCVCGWKRDTMSDKRISMIASRNREIDNLNDRIAALERTIRDHEEDSAALPEDMSITETIKMKNDKITALERKLPIAEKALELACELLQKQLHDNTVVSTQREHVDFYVKHFKLKATQELEATDGN